MNKEYSANSVNAPIVLVAVAGVVSLVSIMRGGEILFLLLSILFSMLCIGISVRWSKFNWRYTVIGLCILGIFFGLMSRDLYNSWLVFAGLLVSIASVLVKDRE